ncbi:MAG TPA: hypothetical protein VLW26_09265 [Steroidobacteraceae bacterium]|nr:hypothetical protein [Steroidobacteraceae bacterium]
MSFREKSAWITFAVLLVSFGSYFAALALQLAMPQHALPPRFLGWIFIVALAGLVILEIALHIIVAVVSPTDARAPKDERDRLIELRSSRVAFYVLLLGTLLAIGVVHIHARLWLLANSVFFAIWIAELTHYGSRLYFYRRSA